MAKKFFFAKKFFSREELLKKVIKEVPKVVFEGKSSGEINQMLNDTSFVAFQCFAEKGFVTIINAYPATGR